ncbi:MAG: hypothetical protein ACRD3V_00720 [Vicinamibacteria bacterium]
MTHLSREDLERWWLDGAPGERDRIVGHLAVCDECGGLFGALIDAQPVAAASRPEARPDLAARAYRAYRRPRRSFRSSWSTPTLVVSAVAAVLLVGLGVVALRAPGPLDDPGGIRGTSLQPLTPIGRVDPPFEFRWASPLHAASYRVEVRDAERRPLFVLFSEGEAVALPPERLLGLTPGEEYWWEVVALGPGGEEIMRAPRRAFSVSPRSP